MLTWLFLAHRNVVLPAPAPQVELPLEFPDGSTPVASRICVHGGTEGAPLGSIDCAFLRVGLAIHSGSCSV